MIPRRFLAPAVALALTALQSGAAINPDGFPTSDCVKCREGITGGWEVSSASFDWRINVGLARYPKPASYAGIGNIAYERNGNVPTFGELVGRIFPASPLQQSQVPLRINQTRISSETFHPSCLTLDSEAFFERLPKSDADGDYLHQIVTDDAITQIDLLSGGLPAGYLTGPNCGPGWQIRVWRRPVSLGDKDGNGYYVTTSLGTPLTNAVICRPQGALTTDNNTLLFLLKETTGVEGSRTTTEIISQTLGTTDGENSFDRPITVVSSLYDGAVTAVPSTGDAPLSREILIYSAHGAKKWDYTITRTVKVQPSPLPSSYSSSNLITTAGSVEDYDDYSPVAPEGGEPGMKRLMSYISSGQTTTYDYYYSDPAVPFTHGRPKSVTRPDGSWTAWEYTSGTAPVFTEYSSWLDLSIVDEETAARKTVTTVDGDKFTTETSIAGQAVAKSRTTLSGQTVTASQWDATASEWHDTVTVYYADDCADPLSQGRVSSVTRPDGTRTTYTYTGSATNQIVTEVVDSVSSVAGSGPDALKTITHYNSGNIAILREVDIYAAGPVYRKILTESWDTDATAGFDALGRPVQRNFADGTTEYTQYTCCGLKKQISRDGTETEYSLDALKRVYMVTVDPPGPAPLATTTTAVTSSAWTSVIASGVTTTRNLTVGTTTVFLGSTTTSLDGLTSLSVEPSRKSTAEADRLHTKTQTTPDGLTTTVYHKRQGDGSWVTDSTTIRYPDGQTYSFTGASGTDPVVYGYGTHNDNGGGLYSTTTSGGLTASTYTDSLGRTFKTIAPTSNPTTYTSQTTYAYCIAADQTAHAGSLGKLKTVTDADSVTTTYGYNVRGELATTTRTIPVGTSYTSTGLESTTTTGSTGDAPTIHGDASLDKCSYKKQVAGSITVSETYATLDGLKTATVTPTGNTLSVRTRASLSNGWTETVLTTHPDGTMTRTTTTPSTSDRTVATARFAKGANTSTGTPVASTTSVYDNFGRLTSTADSRTGTTTYSGHTESGQATSVSDPGSRATTFEYDILGRTIMVDAPNTYDPAVTPSTNTSRVNITRTSYWPSGRVKAVWGDQTYPTVTIYDGQGRISELRTFRKWPHTTDVTGPDENTVNSDTVTVDSTSWSYDATTGRLYQKYYPDGTDTGTAADLAFTYTYTTAGRLYQRVSGRGITTTYGYHAGFLTSVGYVVPTDSGLPATPSLTYTYDSMGRLYTVKRGSILHAQYNYTDLKLTSEDLNQDTAAARTLTRTYEALPDSLPGYRPDGYSFTEGTGGAAVTYSANWAFDTAGRPSSVTDGTDTFTYGYTYTVAGGLHTGAGSGTESAIPFTLDGPQIDVTLAYEATRNVLVSRENTYYPDSSATTLSKFTYTVNAIGLREAVATTGTAFGTTPSNSDRVWKYDPLGQLLSSNSTGTAADRAYTYDSIGNRTGAQADATAVPGTATAGTTLYTANGANQYSSLTVGTGSAFSPAPFYDLDGNMTAGPVPGAAGLTPGVHAPASATLKWDAENRLIEAAVGGTTVDYGYDYLGRLIQRDDGTTVTEYLYDGWNRIAEYGVAAGPIVTLAKTYTWGLDLSGALQGAGGVGGLLSILDKGTGYSYYPTCDGNGNVSEYYKYILDNDTGTTGNQTVSAVAAHFEYDPFGNLTADTYGNAADFPFRFSTKPQDPVTGLYYYGYRWYGSLDGRWPSRDPIGEKGGNNLYGFVGNDGVNRVDLLGQKKCCVKKRPTFSPAGDEHGRISAIYNPDGKLWAALFIVRAEFIENPKDDCCCSCCLVRQYIMWLPKDAPPPHEGFDADGGGKWHMDTNSTREIHFGDRKEFLDFPGFSNNYMTEGKVDMENGCTFEGIDRPHISDSASRQWTEWIYYLKVRDTCTGRFVSEGDSIHVMWPGSNKGMKGK